MTTKYNYEIGERVRAVSGLFEGAEGTVTKGSPSGSSHYYEVQFDGHRFTVWVHYFDLKLVA